MPETTMLPQQSETAPLAITDEQTQKALEPIKEAAVIIGGWAKKLINDERAGQFMTSLAIMARNNPLIAQCTSESLITAMIACVQLDLMPNTPEQLAFIIPYRDNKSNKVIANFQLGYKGLVQLAQRSGMIKAMNTELVFKGDEFDYILGTERKIVHRPNLEIDRTDYSLVQQAYMTAKLTNGEVVFEVMTRKELDKVRNSSKAKSTDAPWTTWPEAMAKKTVIKRAAKMLPSSTADNRLMLAAQFDSWSEAGRLDFKNGQLIEGERNLLKGQRRADAAAEIANTAKLIDTGTFEPKPVETNNG